MAEGIVLFLVTVLSLTVHEFCHGWVADRLGDPTARNLGRLTLDPRAHIDPFMTILMPLFLLYATGGRFTFGGAKPVPVNPRNFRNPSFGFLLVSIAGPMGNFFLAGIAAALVRGLLATGDLPEARTIELACSVIVTNLFLGLFNLMIPIPPLDGSRVLRHFLPSSGQELMDRLEPQGMPLVLLLCYLGLDRVIHPVLLALFRFLVN
ncbi:MAG: site-2 protease family protein [Planctomycetes bacterium]|nr:site-2 protease family protein [Planctomycetota bacterium]